MNQDPVVLIVTSKFGDGHVKVAETIEHAFRSKGVTRIHTIDLFSEVHPRLNMLSRKFYLNSTYPAPELYGLIYEMTSGMKPGRTFGKLLHSLGKRKVQRLINEIHPDVIIHTFPYLAAAQLGEETATLTPVFTVITDYVLHGRWLHPNTTKYFISSDDMKASLMETGITEDAIVVSGIPIRQPFEQIYDREELFHKYNLNLKRKYLLLAAGVYGVLSKINGLIERILDLTCFDVIVVCGNNPKLRSVVEASFHDNSRVQVFGYTDRMHELMCISSVLLTKAGAITLTEALAQRLPIIVYRPLPGQEAGNANSMASRGIIDVAHDETELIHQLRQLLNTTYREERKRVMSHFSRKASSELIVAEVLQVIEQRLPYAAQVKAKLSEGQAKTIHGYL